MAISYQAKLDLIVGGLREIKEAEQRIKKLVNESKKLKRGGIAQRGTVALASVTRTERQASRRSVQIAERRVLLSSRLNAATDLYNRKLQEAARNGAANNKTLQSRVDQIKQAFEVGTKGGQRNLKLVRALATELGRVVEKQNELNRAQSLRSKGFEAGRRGFERIAALESAGFGDVRGLSRAKTLVRGIGAAAATGDQQAYNEALRKAKAVIDRLERQYREGEKAQKDANKAKRDLAKAEREAANQQKAQKSARRRKFTDIATGFGFPLLFGGGPLQALAGGIGGAAGGLGGAIAASAIVSQAEAFAQAAAQTGQALNSTGGALDLMREKSLFSTSAIEERAAVLEEQGKVEELATLLTQELVDKIGNKGVEALQGLGKETDETTRLWAELTLQLQALISGPLQGFLKLVNGFLGGITTGARFTAFEQDLADSPEALKRFKEIEREVRGVKRTNVRGSGQNGGVREELGALTNPRRLEILRRAEEEGLRPVTAKIPVTAADQQRFAVKPKVDKAAREEARLQERLAKLRLEREEIAKITEFKDRIAAAEAVQDQLTARKIQGEQSVYEIQQASLRALVGITDQREVQEIKLLTEEKVAAKRRDNERDLLKIQRERDKLFKDTIENLELQLDIETATTREEAEQLRITQEMKALEGKGLSQDQLGRIRSAKESLSKSQEPLNKFINDSTKALNDFQTLGVTVAQGVGDAFATAMTTGVQELVRGTKSAEEVFADFLNNIANTLMQVAQQMIATYIAIGIAKAFAGLGSATSSTPDPFSSNVASALPDTGNLADVAASTPLKLNAEGSYVSGPTATLVGEGGQGEYIIPESKMRESMARYSRGARGSSVIPEAGGSGTSGEGGGTAVAAPIDVRYTVERINNVDYVTADQFQAGMRQAANEGAKQGEQKTLKRLQMSSGTRRRLGM